MSEPGREAEDLGFLSLPRELVEELERSFACEHDWQPVATETGWLRSHLHQKCSKCKSVKMRSLPEVPEDDEDQDPVRDDPRLRGTDLP